MFQTGLFDFLKNSAELQAVLGVPRSDKATGIWPALAINEPTMPYMVYQRVTGEPVVSYAGANKMHHARFRFRCCGSSYPQATQLAETLKKVFATYTGTWDDGTVVENVTQVLEADDTESVPHGTVYIVHTDFMFSYVDNS